MLRTLHSALQLWPLLKNDKVLPKNLSALTELVEGVEVFLLAHQCTEHFSDITAIRIMSTNYVYHATVWVFV
jgi:hypothetical protein